MATNPRINQNEGSSIAPTSSYGQLLKQNIFSTFNDYRVQSARTYLFRGFGGAYVGSRQAKTYAIFAKSGYQGEFPLEEQPTIDKPLPYRKRG